MLHRTRELLIRQRTMLVNAIRGHMAEFGIAAGQGPANAKTLLAVIADRDDARLPSDARTCLRRLAVQVTSIDKEIAEASQHIQHHFRSNPVSRRLETIPGIGPVIATAISASVTDPAVFQSGRASQLGSGWCLGRCRPVASSDLDGSQNKVILICDG